MKQARNDGTDEVTGNSEDDVMAEQPFELHNRSSHSRHHEKQKLLDSNVNRRTRTMRVVAFGVLILSAAAVCSIVYHYIRSSEKQHFEETFDSQAARILELFHQSVDARLQAIDSLSTAITTFAAASGSTFPNVTIPSFEMLGCNSRILTGSVYIMFALLVTDQDRAGWEAYAEQKQGQFFETSSLDIAQRQRQDVSLGHNKTPAIPTDINIDNYDITSQFQFVPSIHRTNPDGTENLLEPQGTGPYLPIWQVSPVLPSPGILKLNMLAYTFLKGSLETLLATQHAVIEEASELKDPNKQSDFNEGTAESVEVFLGIGQFRHDKEEYRGDPISPFHYPVFDNFGEDRKVVGVVATVIYWRLHFSTALSDEVKGITCVIENTLNQTFSFELAQNDVVYVGKRDTHESKYDGMVFEADIADYINATKSAATRSYTSVELDRAFSNYKIRVYPTSDMEDEFLTYNPILFSGAILIVFIFTSAVFIIYDCMVERRQRVVVDKAVKSGAVVSSLFPESVQARLYQEHDAQNQTKSQQGKTNLFTKAKFDGFHTMSKANSDVGGGGDGRDSSKALKGAPIADKFENTSILFADLVGFIQWSSSRKAEDVFHLLEQMYGAFDRLVYPMEFIAKAEDVFHLLEQVYGAFDRLARDMNVFKVETIGDCYLAATGLPNPQPKHAVIMCQFASGCLKLIEPTLRNLMDDLGPETMDLGLRVGIHSGEVTAGVLRGEKSRFQVFGDTVNTASRMESSSVRNRIQCSQSVADELILLHHAHWLEARKGMVSLKGKGEMQTYFVNVHDNAPSSHRTDETVDSGVSAEE
eukprot:CAMPEP_0119570876 /NCGR_PEP_ID=MMETSP1352-20130426/43835_1 /TAXON_ID=265584 /ORGANISM="Stauroneis constricta, Strain CCMP1120" /LENGTH=813 /DNA_ID=CAMNT_0007620553 /DNA_START=258 /DNA_END=2700 /DNA_ORIENTATION=-